MKNQQSSQMRGGGIKRKFDEAFGSFRIDIRKRALQQTKKLKISQEEYPPLSPPRGGSVYRTGGYGGRAKGVCGSGGYGGRTKGVGYRGCRCGSGGYAGRANRDGYRGGEEPLLIATEAADTC